MRNLGKVIGHIPARGGSKRVAAKNLRYLCGKPLLAYAIDCALASGVLDEVYVNTDSDTMGALAEACGAKFYRRATHLATDTASGDDFTADFMRVMQPTTLVMVSPVCPLVTPDDVRAGIEAYRASTCDTLITCHETQMQTFCAAEPVNIDLSGPLAPTQRNPVVQILNWAVTIWDTATFLRSYDERQSGYIGTNRHLLPIEPLRALKISHEDEFQMAELLVHALRQAGGSEGPAHFWTPGDGIPWKQR